MIHPPELTFNILYDTFEDKDQYTSCAEVLEILSRRIGHCNRPDIIYLYMSTDYSFYIITTPDERARSMWDNKWLYIERVVDAEIPEKGDQISLITANYGTIDIDGYDNIKNRIPTILKDYYSTKKKNLAFDMYEYTVHPLRMKLIDTRPAIQPGFLEKFSKNCRRQFSCIPAIGIRV